MIGNRRVAQHVDPHDAMLGEALRPPGAHVVLVDLVEEERPVEPQVGRDADGEPDQDRQRRVPEQVLGEAVAPALDREPAQPVGEEVLEHDDVDEDRDRQTDGADDHHQPVGERAADVGDGQREADRDQRLQHQQRHQHGQRRPQPGGEDLRDALVGAPRCAEVGGEDLLDEDPQLHPVGLVDAQLPADVVDLLLARDLAGEHVGGVAPDPVEQQEDEQDDARHRRDHLPQPTEHVRDHRCPSPGDRRVSRRFPRGRGTASGPAGSGAADSPARPAAAACCGNG